MINLSKTTASTKNNFLSKKNQILLSLFIIFVFMGTFLFVWKIKLSRTDYYRPTLYTLNNKADTLSDKLSPDTKIVQDFAMISSHFYGISVSFSDLENYPGDISVSVSDKDNNIIFSDQKSHSDAVNDTITFTVKKDANNLPMGIDVNKGELYKLTITTQSSFADNTPSIYVSASDTYKNGTLYINDIPQNGDICFGIYADVDVLLIKELFRNMTLAILIFVFIILLINVLNIKIKVEYAFLFSILFWGIIYSFLLPTATAPDEPQHFITSYKLSNTLMGISPAVSPDDYVYVRAEDYDIYQEIPIYDTFSLTYKDFFKKGDENLIEYKGLEYRSSDSIAYVPQSLGITVARLLGLGYQQLLLMGRFFNLLFFAIIVFFAIKLTPIGKKTFFIIAHFPMVLELISSYSTDAPLLALSFLFIGYIFYLIYKKEKVSIFDIILLAIIGFLFVPIKIAYLPMVGLCILIPNKKFKNKKFFFAGVALIIIYGAASTMIQRLNAFVSEVTTDNIIKWSQTPGYVVSDFIEHPFLSIRIILNTIFEKSDDYLFTMAGGKLCWLTLNLPTYVIGIFYIIFFISLLSVEGEENTWTAKISQRIWIWFIVGATVILLFYAMLLGWTPYGYEFVEGIQGRYFIPLLPLGIVLLKNKTVVIKKKSEYFYLIATAMANSLMFLYIFCNIAKSWLDATF